MKLSRILTTVAAAGLVIAPIAAEANTRASASTFSVESTQFTASAIGSRQSSNVPGLHGQDGGGDFTWLILLLLTLFGGGCAAACGGGGQRSPG